MATTTFHAPGTVYQPLSDRKPGRFALAAVIQRLIGDARSRKDHADLEAMTDHQLKDIGLTRGDVYRITHTGV